MYRTIPNSHFWSSLEGVYNTIEHKLGEPVTPKYIIIGLENCRKEGYKLKPTFEEDVKVVQNADMFTSIEQMIDYLSHEDFNMSTFKYLIRQTLAIGMDLKNERKMEREKVYKRIDKERKYQDLRWDVRKNIDKTPDAEKPVAEWLNYIEFHIAKAKEKVYMLENDAALAEIRKVTALAVRCLEIHGCPKRIIPKELKKE